MPKVTEQLPKDGRIFQGGGPPHDAITKLPAPPPWRNFSRGSQARRGETYHASTREIELVNAALYLRRPLLISGRPGVGKTSLAHAVAWELQLGEVLTWPINSRSTLQQGLYDYDAIGRVREASIATEKAAGRLDPQGNSTIGSFIRLGPLGTAMLGGMNRPRVLLIDEIDKGDIDLPNDLLNAFEEGEFDIRELARYGPSREETVATFDGGTTTVVGGKVTSTAFPVVFLTSNGEREFPPAFLRRCLRLDIEPPVPGDLARIVANHLGMNQHYEVAVKKLIAEFVQRRDEKGLATDQLLNSVFLAIQGINLDERESLRLALMRSLMDGG